MTYFNPQTPIIVTTNDTSLRQTSRNSREALLIGAGPLFAKYGYDGVTTRMISEAAGVQLSAVHYHFSTKENLYLETFRYVHDKEKKVDFFEILAENPALGETAEGLAEVIRTTVLRYFRNIFAPDRPDWEVRLLVREIVNPSAALPQLAETFMQANVVNSEKFCRLVRPDISKTDAAVWADTLFSHAIFYALAKKHIEMVRGQGWLSQDFYYKAARMIARFMILELELPLPHDLKHGYGDMIV
ncbi:MAG: TetR/AcrR family transcriptional regulator [Desulfopila sp.]|jgi:AcrR family transcriptional regulator|nr:TetR/AcrR family transcriptional regulator [Desulfopila sp.]